MREQLLQKFAELNRRRNTLWQTVSLFGIAHALSACGGGGDDTPLPANPGAKVPDFRPDPEEPYWVNGLISGRTQFLPDAIASGEAPFKIAFPEIQPAYLEELNFENSQYTTGWTQISPQMFAVYQEVIADIESVFDVKFEIVEDPAAPDTISIQLIDGSAYQTLFGVEVAGFAVPAFQETDTLFLGYDIFIDDDYTDPQVLPSGLVNFDYTVAVHELGHVLGLKHPGEVELEGESILPPAEDDPDLTIMYVPPDGFYDEGAFTGFYQPFDLMALAHLYGVNPSYNGGDTIYRFNSEDAVYVLDGDGRDQVSADGRTDSVLISLIPETQSYAGTKSESISDPLQLTISAGTEIEVASGGGGDDILIGNDLSNTLLGRLGNDSIFGGEGADTIYGGSGSDVIDLSEDDAARDRVELGRDAPDLIGGFDIGFLGDIASIEGLSLAPLLDVYSIVEQDRLIVSGEIIRISGVSATREDDIGALLTEIGVFSWLQINPGDNSYIVLAASQNTGEAQIFAEVDGVTGDIIVLAEFVGGAMDIDLWNDTNFA